MSDEWRWLTRLVARVVLAVVVYVAVSWVTELLVPFSSGPGVLFYVLAFPLSAAVWYWLDRKFLPNPGDGRQELPESEMNVQASPVADIGKGHPLAFIPGCVCLLAVPVITLIGYFGPNYPVITAAAVMSLLTGLWLTSEARKLTPMGKNYAITRIGAVTAWLMAAGIFLSLILEGVNPLTR